MFGLSNISRVILAMKSVLRICEVVHFHAFGIKCLLIILIVLHSFKGDKIWDIS